MLVTVQDNLPRRSARLANRWIMDASKSSAKAECSARSFTDHGTTWRPNWAVGPTGGWISFPFVVQDDWLKDFFGPSPIDPCKHDLGITACMVQPNCEWQKQTQTSSAPVNCTAAVTGTLVTSRITRRQTINQSPSIRCCCCCWCRNHERRRGTRRLAFLICGFKEIYLKFIQMKGSRYIKIGLK